MEPLSFPSLPPNLEDDLPYPTELLRPNDSIAEQMEKSKNQVKFELRRGQPGYQFVQRLFCHNPPRGTMIKKVYFLNNPDLKHLFEIAVQEADKKMIDATWLKAEPQKFRDKMFQRWQSIAKQFSPFNLNGKKYSNAKIVPLWFGPKDSRCFKATNFRVFGFRAGFPKDAHFPELYELSTSSKFASLTNNKYLLLTFVVISVAIPIVNSNPFRFEVNRFNRFPRDQYYALHKPTKLVLENSKFDLCSLTDNPAIDNFLVSEYSQIFPFCLVAIANVIPASLAGIKAARPLLKGNTDLHEAVFKKDFPTIQDFVNDRNKLNACNDENISPFMLAGLLSDIFLCEYFLEYLADEKIACKTFKQNILHYAAHDGNCVLIRLLLKHRKKSLLESVNLFGWTPFLCATVSGRVHAMQELYMAKANVRACDKDMCTALHLAVGFRQVAAIQYLLKFCGKEELEIRNNKGMTPLSLAASLDHSEVYQLLLAAGANKEAVSKEEQEAKRRHAKNPSSLKSDTVLASQNDRGTTLLKKESKN